MLLRQRTALPLQRVCVVQIMACLLQLAVCDCAVETDKPYDDGAQVEVGETQQPLISQKISSR